MATVTKVLSTAELRKRAAQAERGRIVTPDYIVQPPVGLNPEEVRAIANELDRLRKGQV